MLRAFQLMKDNHSRTWLAAGLALFCAATFSASAQAQSPTNAPATPPAARPVMKPFKKVYPIGGKVERLDPALDALIPPIVAVERLAGGFQWTEGPVWNPKTQTLFFSDVPRNVVFEWMEGAGTRDYLIPSGYTGPRGVAGGSGSNGLTLDKQGRLVLCQQGDRRVARLEKDGRFTTVADYYLDRRLNSPNDLVYRGNGDLYFTDPPYGLAEGNADPAKELLFNGVYLVRKSGEVVLLTKELTSPNGIALSPDDNTLFVANSDPAKPVIMAYPVKADGTIGAGRVFFDAAPLAAQGGKGMPDGMKVDAKGNLFATGPGGVLVISPEGKHLGTISTGETVANCAWGDDGSTLFMTSPTVLSRIKTLTKGKGF
jgi:gluconolactonase